MIHIQQIEREVKRRGFSPDKIVIGHQDIDVFKQAVKKAGIEDIVEFRAGAACATVYYFQEAWGNQSMAACQVYLRFEVGVSYPSYPLGGAKLESAEQLKEYEQKLKEYVAARQTKIDEFNAKLGKLSPRCGMPNYYLREGLMWEEYFESIGD